MSVSRIKVQLAVSQAYPVLLSALRSISEDHRADRFRALALVGLHIEKGTAYVLPTLTPTPVFGGTVSGPLEELTFHLVLNEATPTLFAEIASTPARFRAERLRTLATLGAGVESGRVEMRVSGAVQPVVAASHGSTHSSRPKPLSIRQKSAPEVSFESSDVASHSVVARQMVSEPAVVAIEQRVEAPVVAVVSPPASPVSGSDRVGNSVRRFSRLLGDG